jgi:hypothetical protein
LSAQTTEGVSGVSKTHFNCFSTALKSIFLYSE